MHPYPSISSIVSSPKNIKSAVSTNSYLNTFNTTAESYDYSALVLLMPLPTIILNLSVAYLLTSRERPFIIPKISIERKYVGFGYIVNFGDFNKR